MEKLEINTFKHIAYMETGDLVLSWNRFYPSLLTFKKDDFPSLLKLVDDNALKNEFDDDFLAFLRKNHLLADEDYVNKFANESLLFQKKCQEKMIAFCHNEEPFYSIQIFNEECNLNCPYCILKYTWGKLPSRKKSGGQPPDAIYNRITRIIDKQYECMKKHAKDEFVFSINGGEFLLHYGLLSRIIAYIRENKGDKKSKIALNTNGTLINDETARFLQYNNVHVFISIDANQTHHDATRVYHNGDGSYDNVINSVHLLKKYNVPNDSLSTIQGTIDDFSKIDLNEVFSMAEYGFESARLSTNLMDMAPEEGKKRAELFFEIVKQSSAGKIKIHDGIFNNFANAVDKGVNSSFGPFCNGLGGRASSSLMYNISDDSLSYLCQYVTQAFLHIDGDIVKYMHSKELGEKALDFIRKRAESVLHLCKDCSIVGICRGGCIMDGLTVQNKLNESACNYQKTLWSLYINDLFVQKTRVQTNATQ